MNSLPIDVVYKIYKWKYAFDEAETRKYRSIILKIGLQRFNLKELHRSINNNVPLNFWFSRMPISNNFHYIPLPQPTYTRPQLSLETDRTFKRITYNKLAKENKKYLNRSVKQHHHKFR